ncbi:MAG: hypothetical protein ACON4M_03565 [Crocinitomicaceae bacterium]
MKNSFNFKFIGIHNIQNVVLFCMLFFSCCCFSQEQSVRYVYSQTTAEAINELNHIVPDYEKRKVILLEMKRFEKEGVVFLSSKQFAPISKRIDYVNSNSNENLDQEILDYADDAQKRYLSIKKFVKEK